MKKSLILILLSLALFAFKQKNEQPINQTINLSNKQDNNFTGLQKNTGKQLFQQFCGACHSIMPDKAKRGKMIAPPMMGVVRHYKKAYPKKNDFVKAIINWAEKPEKSKSLMPGAIQKFKIMPPMPAGKENLQKIAEYLYKDVSPNKRMMKHHGKHHGNKGHKCGKCGM